MERTVLIRGARQLLTLRGPATPRKGEAMGQLGVIEDGALLIVDGIISNVGPSRRIENLAPARHAEEINAAGRVVMPGFIDSHTHLIAALPQMGEARAGPYGPDPLQSSELSRHLADASVDHVRRTSAAGLEHQARRLLQRCVRHGSTTIEVKSGFGLDETGEMKMLRALGHLAKAELNVVATFLAPHLRHPDFEGTIEEHLHMVRSVMLPKVKTRNLAHFVDAVCDPSALDLPQAQAVLTAAASFGFPVKTHVELTKRTGAVSMAVEMNSVSVDGLNHADVSDAKLLARSNTVAVLMPGPLHPAQGLRLAPARMLIDNGAAVALASGFYPPLCSTYNMSTLISIACAHMRLTPVEAISATTINGAHAVGRAARTGSLEYGKEADLIMLGVSDYREIPYHFGVNLVTLTMQKGQVVYREGAVQCGGEL